MKAFLINAESKQITETTIPDGDNLKAMQAAVGGLIEPAFEFDNTDTVYVNEEGLFGDRRYWFEVKGAHQPFVGNAIVIGYDPDSGDTVAAKSTLEEISAAVTFKTFAEVSASVTASLHVN